MTKKWKVYYREVIKQLIKRYEEGSPKYLLRKNKVDS